MRTRRDYLMAGAGLAAIGAAGLAMPSAARAQAWDGTPIRLVVGYPPGGASDTSARILAEALQAKLKTQVLVENKTGAGGRISAQQVKAAPPNPVQLLVGNPAIMVVAPMVFKDVGYDPERDFEPVSQLNTYEFAVSVSTAVPVRELSHLLAWLRANPEKANYGVPATGSLPHFFALMMAERTGVKGTVVGYRGSAPLITDLIGGQIPVSIDTFETVLPHHQAGKLRILAVSGEKRSSFAPQIPTFREAGLDLVAHGFGTLFAPSTLPRERVEQLGMAVRDVMLDPQVQRRFTDAKMTPTALTPAQTRAVLERFRAQWAPVVKGSGFQP